MTRANFTAKKCPSCGDVSNSRDVVNSEVDKCKNCGFEAYVWSFKRA